MTEKLSCGGRGPCCHIGYSHRHCEHCDTVIATSLPWPYYQQPWPYYYYNNTGTAVLPRFLWTNAATSQSINAQSVLPAATVHACEDER